MAKEELKKVDAEEAKIAEEELSEDELDAVSGGGWCLGKGCSSNGFCDFLGNWSARADAEAEADTPKLK